ncbi:MAG: hypothetical protein E4H48_06520 [Syntrophobacterales bacterium]|nr:MAG: hypothetical protein E4H48_06520 [Syntrophobacterales bacterium]
MQTRIPAVFMRGGTSKGLFFHERHLTGTTGSVVVQCGFAYQAETGIVQAQMSLQ